MGLVTYHNRTKFTITVMDISLKTCLYWLTVFALIIHSLVIFVYLSYPMYPSATLCFHNAVTNEMTGIFTPMKDAGGGGGGSTGVDNKGKTMWPSPC